MEPTDRRSFRGIPQDVPLSPQEWQVLQEFEAAVKGWGWTYDAQGAAGSLQPHVVRLVSVPVICGTQLNSTELRMYLHQLRDTAGAGTAGLHVSGCGRPGQDTEHFTTLCCVVCRPSCSCMHPFALSGSQRKVACS